MALPKNSLRIRMYHVGFGDSFLMSWNLNGADHHVLVDCGVHARGTLPFPTMADVVKQIKDETGGNLELVIATHRHQDHIAGFGEPGFKGFAAAEVWMPWTEDPSDPTAKKLRAQHNKLAAALASAVKLDAARYALANLDLARNATSLEMLRSGFTGTVRYLKAGDKPELPPSMSEDFSVTVLGPPRDPKWFSKMNPPTLEHYLALNGRNGKNSRIHPFVSKWVIGKPGKLRKVAGEVDKAMKSSADELALNLDNVLNNTSLVLLFSIRGQHLLFPGDAQWGNWNSWIGAQGSELLPQVTFYKVAHHGSLNATPRTVVEEMPQGGFRAMVSTQNKPFPSVPRLPLLRALDQKSGGHLVRSDGPATAKLPQPFIRGKFWIDYPMQL